MCNMSYFGQHVTSCDLDLRANFDPTFHGHPVHVTTHFDERNKMVI